MVFKCSKSKKSKADLKKVVSFLKIISEENRLKILCLLKGQEKCVCDIWQFLNLPQNLVSHHLRVLKSSGLINSRKEGTKVFYSLNQENIEKFISLFSHFV